jgi:hypothetical protein
MIELLYIPYQAITARMSGGGLGAHVLDRFKATWLPEVFFALPFGFALSQVVGPWGWLAAVWSYLWMQTGHGVVLPWGKALQYTDKDRAQTLSPFVDWLSDRLKIQKVQSDGYSKTLNYCRLFMAVKGFLIGLPVGGISLAVFWPLAYEIGHRLDNAALKEWLAGTGAALAVILFL